MSVARFLVLVVVLVLDLIVRDKMSLPERSGFPVIRKRWEEPAFQGRVRSNAASPPRKVIEQIHQGAGSFLPPRLRKRYGCLFFGVSAHSPDGRNCRYQADDRQGRSDCSSLISSKSIRQQKGDPRSKHGSGRDDPYPAPANPAAPAS
jgi:hypothetical protein